MTPSRVTESIPAKKNRLEDSLQEEDDDPTAEQPETEKVGHIREKVHQLSTHEIKAAKPETDNKPEDDNAAAAPSPSASKDNTTAAPAKDTDAPTRTQPTFSAFSSKSSPFSAVPSSSGSSGAKSGFSAFAARSSSPLVGSGIKPSSLGSSIGGHHSESTSASSSAAPSSSTSAPAKPIVKGSTFGFGAFAGASPLAKPKSPAPTASPKEADKAEPSDDKATFEQKLLSEDKNAVAETKAKPLLEVSEESKSLHSHTLHRYITLTFPILQPKRAKKTRRPSTASVQSSTPWQTTSRGKNAVRALCASTSPSTRPATRQGS
jgi:Ran-binding protein 3